jgi:dienelactone hydrolase
MKKNNKTFPTKKILRVILVIALAVILIWGIQWATYARPPLPEAVAALESNDLVAVTQDPWLTFSPTQDTPTAGFIFYPGGRINPQAYASLMRTIAAEGYLVVVPEMPINMAVFNPNIADKIIAAYPEIDHWVIGGHSVGGTMAAQYTGKHPGVIDGLVIWASYPADSTDISGLDIPVVSIYGSRDPRVNETSIGKREHLLPQNTLYICIEGGDHHQFGAYEITPEEDFATISQGEQHEQIIAATLALLSEVNQSK